uniref:Uncharacterized protein n=1 Tax=Avena sativa TaxID=4498 RepID=A0ACD5V8Y7_AVESA
MSLNSDEEGLNCQAISLSSSQSCLHSLHSLSPCRYRCISTLRGHSSYVSGLAVDGNSLYVASSDGHVRLWPLDMGTTRVQQEEQCGSVVVAVTDSPIKCLMATSDGLVSSHQDGKIRVWQAGRRNRGSSHLALQSVLPTTVDCLRTFLFPKNYVEVRRHRSCTWVHHVDAVTALAVSPDGAYMYSASWDRSLKVWRLPSLRCVESVAPAHEDAINAVAVSSDGRVYTGSADRTIKEWRRHLGQKYLTLVCTMQRHRSAVNALAIGVGGVVLYSGSCDRSVVVWEGAAAGGGMAATGTLRGHTEAVLCLAAAGDVVCSGSADRTVRVWRRGAEGGYSCLAVLDGHGAAVKSLALVLIGGDHGRSCNGQSSRCTGCSALVYSGSLDCDVKIWRVT